ncbi:glycosyltransferase family 2 protein [Thiorhodococcus fuscus]|uniref:Glycosyltransferase family 2 protein n=1 Tax=Thiorhodococcus fuscus TaxID=527200 RepID=A0ABW4YAS8_9GAMM
MSGLAISVVMPNYNRADRLSLAIDSLLAQTFTDFELIVVDDGSTDESLDVIARYAARDSRIRFLSLPINGGQGIARALGNDAAEGRYIAVMDNDDIAFPQRLETQYAFMESNPEITLAGSNAIKVMPNQRMQMRLPEMDSAIKARLLLVDAAFVHPTVIMRRDFLRKHNLNYAAERRGDDDYEFYNRLLQAGARFANMPQTLLEYHRHGGNTSSNTPRLQQDKLPLRRFLLGLFYPDLTGREVLDLARIMQMHLKVNIKDAYAGILAAEKAMRIQVSQFGEDHSILNAFIYRAVMRLEQALKKSVALNQGDANLEPAVLGS